MKYSKLSQNSAPAVMAHLLVMAFSILTIGCGEKDSPSGNHQVTAIIQIHPTESNFHTTTENFIANEITSLSLGTNLTAAASKNNWKPKDINLDEVQKNLVVTQIPETDMARITLHSDDPDPVSYTHLTLPTN